MFMYRCIVHPDMSLCDHTLCCGRFQDLGQHECVLRYWGSFMGEVPVCVLALLRSADRELMERDEYGARRSPVHSMFGVLDAHPQVGRVFLESPYISCCDARDGGA